MPRKQKRKLRQRPNPVKEKRSRRQIFANSRPFSAGEKERRQFRQQEALQLRLRGLTYKEIGEELNINYKSAWRYVNRELKNRKALSEQNLDKVRKLEIERLDKLVTALWSAAVNGLPLRGKYGKILRDREGNKLTAVDTKSVESMLKVMSRRSKLLGLDAPKQQNISYEDAREKALQIKEEADLLFDSIPLE